jgi:hypothetical protein
MSINPYQSPVEKEDDYARRISMFKRGLVLRILRIALGVFFVVCAILLGSFCHGLFVTLRYK